MRVATGPRGCKGLVVEGFVPPIKAEEARAGWRPAAMNVAGRRNPKMTLVTTLWPPAKVAALDGNMAKFEERRRRSLFGSGGWISAFLGVC